MNEINDVDDLKHNGYEQSIPSEPVAKQSRDQSAIYDPFELEHDKYFQESKLDFVRNSIFNIYGKNIALAILTHSLWSALPVMTRYLLVKAPSHMNSLVLLSSTKLTAFILIHIFGDFSFVFKLPESKLNNTSVLESQQEERGKLQNEIQEDVTVKKKIYTALLFALLTTCRAALGIECLRYTTAKNTALIQALSPLIVPIADSIILKTKMPKGLWSTVIFSVLGCAIVLLSQSRYRHTFTTSDSIGCIMKFIAVSVTSITRLIMKTSANVLTRNELLQFANVGTFIIPLVFTLFTNPNVWLYFVELPNLPIAVIFAWTGIGVLVYFLAAAMQVELIRELSPGLYSSFEAIRVIGAILLSSIWLNENVENWIEWVGICLTVGVISWYLYVLLIHQDDDVDWDDEQSVAESIKRNEWEEYGCYVRLIF